MFLVLKDICIVLTHDRELVSRCQQLPAFSSQAEEEAVVAERQAVDHPHHRHSCHTGSDW